MHDTKKLIYSDFGKGHSSIKWTVIAMVLGLVSNIMAFRSRWSRWELQQEFYFLWHELPSPPSITWFVFINIVLILLTVVEILGIRKHELHIYDDGIEGRGYKGFIVLFGAWGKEFKLEYSDIMSVKQRKWGLIIRTTIGRYMVCVNDPQGCANEISKCKYKRVDSEDASVYEKTDVIDKISNHFIRFCK